MMGRETDWEGFNKPAHWGREKKEGDTSAFHWTKTEAGLVTVRDPVVVEPIRTDPMSTKLVPTSIKCDGVTITCMLAMLLSL